jgi:hypothetical protein
VVKAAEGVAKESYLYRGVHAGHPVMSAALEGRVIPGNVNGSVTAELHNHDPIHVANSPFTSWTSDITIAETNALKNGPGGVILRVPMGAPPPGATWSWSRSPDRWGESERLLRGIRSGAEVIKP